MQAGHIQWNLSTKIKQQQKPEEVSELLIRTNCFAFTHQIKASKLLPYFPMISNTVVIIQSTKPLKLCRIFNRMREDLLIC